jgi:hypothetical protein
MVTALDTARGEYTRKGKVKEADGVTKDLEWFLELNWDPRSSPDVDYNKVIVKSENGQALAHDRANSFKRDLNPNAKVIVVGDKAYVSEFEAGRTVLCTHPFNDVSPATIDFGDLTLDKIGTLTLLARCYPKTDGCRLVVKVDGRNIGDTRVRDEDGWKEIPVPFSKNSVVVEHYAVNWGMEFMFFEYRIVYHR